MFKLSLFKTEQEKLFDGLTKFIKQQIPTVSPLFSQSKTTNGWCFQSVDREETVYFVISEEHLNDHRGNYDDWSEYKLDDRGCDKTKELFLTYHVYYILPQTIGERTIENL